MLDQLYSLALLPCYIFAVCGAPSTLLGALQSRRQELQSMHWLMVRVFF